MFGMVELAKRLDFDLEAVAKTLFLGQGGGEKFDGGRLARLVMHALVDRPHAAAAQLADDPIRSEPFDFHEQKVASGSG